MRRRGGVQKNELLLMISVRVMNEQRLRDVTDARILDRSRVYRVVFGYILPENIYNLRYVFRKIDFTEVSKNLTRYRSEYNFVRQ